MYYKTLSDTPVLGTAVNLVVHGCDMLLRNVLHPKALHRQRNHMARLQYYNSGITTTADSSKTNVSELAESIVSEKVSVLSIGTIARQSDSGDLILTLQIEERKDATSKRQSCVVNLVEFGTKLEALYDQTIFTNTYCFIYDAACGLGSYAVELMETALKKDISTQANWMVDWCLLQDQHVISDEKLLKVLSALLRLSHTDTFQIPTAIVPTLLPRLYKLFPNHRHLFLYTGCVQSVLHKRPDKLYTTSVVDFKSVHVMPDYWPSLAKLNVATALATDCWVAACDTLLVLQDEYGTKLDDPFCPYVCKLDYLWDGNSTTVVEPESSRYWAVRSLLQYVTGSMGRELSTETMDTAIHYLQQTPNNVPTFTKKHPAIEEVVFHHKLILIAHKTLKDTVPPMQHWSLKQAVKGGCACCMEEEEEEEEEETTTTVPRKSSNDIANVRGGFVDGKTAFAFDPTKFS